jgi:hypothetical protein
LNTRRFPPPWSIEKAGRRIVWSLDCGPRWNIPAAFLSELFFGGLSGALRFLLRNNILLGK